MTGESDAAKAFGCRTLVERNGARVVIRNEIRSDYDTLLFNEKAKLQRNMEIWCDEKPMTKEMINRNEGRSPSGTMLQALKTFKKRLYGSEITIGDMRTFVIVDLDLSKKRTKADPRILNRAKGRVDALGREENS